MRTTEEAVREIAEVDPLLTSLTPWLEMASLIVEENLVGQDLSDARLEMIERNLAAHFFKCDRDPLASSEGAGGVSQGNIISTGQRLDSTPYGQKAILLDTSGTLLAMSEGRPLNSVFMRWGGRSAT